MTVSEFARSAVMEKVEVLQDVDELRAALGFDSGERFTAAEICRELGCWKIGSGFEPQSRSIDSGGKDVGWAA